MAERCVGVQPSVAELPCAELAGGGPKGIVADANRIAILRVASPNRRRRAAAAAKEDSGQKVRDLTLAREELAELKRGLDVATSNLVQKQVVPPLPEVLAQLDQNFESMRELCAQGLAHMSTSTSCSSLGLAHMSTAAAPLSDVQLAEGRPSAEHGELIAAARRVEQEMTTFWRLLSGSVDPPVLIVLQKLHSTIMQVSKDVAARPASSQAITAAEIPPPDLDELLEALSMRHPALAREIGRTTATALKFEYVQACARRSDNQRRQEVWQALAAEEKRDLAQVHNLAEGAQDEFFLTIVEQDRRQRQELSEMEMPAVAPAPRPGLSRTFARGAPPPAASSRAEATRSRISASSQPPVSVRSRISAFERSSSASLTRSQTPVPRNPMRSPTSATPRSARGLGLPAASSEAVELSRLGWEAGQQRRGPGRPTASSEAVEPSRLAAWAGEQANSDEAPNPPRLANWAPRLRQHASSPPDTPRRALAAGIVRDRVRLLNSASLDAL